MENLYAVTAVWPHAVDTPANIGRKFLDTLDRLGTLEPWLSDWITWINDGDEERYPIETLRKSIANWVRDRVFIGDLGQRDVSNGYHVFAITDQHRAWPMGCRSSFGVRAGSVSEITNHAVFEVGSPPPLQPDLAYVTFDLYRAALLAIIDIWPSYWANASCWIWGQDPPALPGEPPRPNHSGFQMPWISYLSREAAGGLALPTGIETESTPDGGLLMIATRQRFDPFNVEHMRASRIILEIMITHNGGLGR
jgi:hypothetical protein